MPESVQPNILKYLAARRAENRAAQRCQHFTIGRFRTVSGFSRQPLP